MKKPSTQVKLRPIYYDTETTGLNPEEDRIVEIAAFDPTTGETFDSLVNPGFPIPEAASKVHNITDDMVKEAAPFSKVSVEFTAFCQENAILIAHNNDAFDVHFLRAEYKRNGHLFPNWQFLDTLKWARRYRPDLPRHTLQFLREIYGVASNNAHRALDDVVVLHEVFQRMTDDLPIETIYSLLNTPRLLRVMPFGKHQGKPLKEVPANYIAWLKKNGALDKAENASLKMSLEALSTNG